MTGATNLAGAVVGAVVLTACGPPADRAAVAEPARVEILSPASGDTVSLPATLRLRASSITIVAASGLREEGMAHHHLLVDADHSPEGQPIPTGNGYIHLGSGASEWVLDSLPAGVHRIIARLAWGDHVPVAGAGTDTIMIVVR